jgi:hypothetical protein
MLSFLLLMLSVGQQKPPTNVKVGSCAIEE